MYIDVRVIHAHLYESNLLESNSARVANIPGDWMAINETAVVELSEALQPCARIVLRAVLQAVADLIH